jgi:formylmethanofuran dehydrogenase subunit B
MADLVCAGCGSLCDGIQVEIEENRIAVIDKACAKGAAFLNALNNPKRRTTCLVNREEVSSEKAIEEAKRLLSQSKKPLIFGLDNSTLETQAIAISLAEKLGAVLDDASSFSYGEIISSLLKGFLPGCSLSQIKDRANLLVYWGSNPMHSHPRHLSEHSYYAYTEYDIAGWVPKVKLSCVEVRDTEFSYICNPAFMLSPGKDREFIQNVLSLIKTGNGTEEAKTFCDLFKSSRLSMIFCGRGLVYSLDGDFSLFNEMVSKLGQWTKACVIPMIDDVNMFGFNKLLRQKTGHINQVSFSGGVSHGPEFSFLEQIRREAPDCVLIAGSDPVSTLPLSLRNNLAKTKVICLSSLITPTTKAADVVIATAAPGWEQGGKVIRMDGEEVRLGKVRESTYPSEGDILERLLGEKK